MPTNDFEYKIVKPDILLDAFIESFWMLENISDADKEVVVVPDGRIDITFTFKNSDTFNVKLLGIDKAAVQNTFGRNTKMFAISLKLLGAEYLFDKSISYKANQITKLPIDFWDFKHEDLKDFKSFVLKASNKIEELVSLKEVDGRKQKLFELIYETNGSISVKELSEKLFWQNRQINRYFNQKFGISLKAYCNILRFRASFSHINEGELFPQQNFSDQSHFIKEIKKLSGVVPKELYKNKNDRFIQFLVLSKK